MAIQTVGTAPVNVIFSDWMSRQISGGWMFAPAKIWSAPTMNAVNGRHQELACVAEHRLARHARGNRLAGEEPPAPLEEVRQGERIVHHQVVEARRHCDRPPGATSPRSSDVAQRKPTKWWPAAAPRRS